MRPRSILLFVAAWAVTVSPVAHAIVGGREEPDALARSTLMVLGSGGNLCSAVVVAPDVVLTAAHCVTNAAEHRVHYTSQNREPVLIAPAAIAVHPGYDKGAIQGRRRSIDLALVRLPAALPASFAVVSLAAGAGPPRIGQEIAVGGYGVSREGDQRSAGTFRAASLSVIEPYGPGRILLWAADPAGQARTPGAGACQGDSGGPLTRAGAVVAISTWSTGPAKRSCGLLTQGVLVAPQRAWLDATLAGWSRSARWLP